MEPPAERALAAAVVEIAAAMPRQIGLAALAHIASADWAAESDSPAVD